MRTFKLYVVHKSHRALITSFDGTDHSYVNTTITYDEQLSEAENDQFTLTFSMPRYVAVDTDSLQQIRNYWLDIVKMGSRLQLIIDDKRRIDFIVSAVAPALSRSNIVYNFTAQDEVSYLWSRHNLGYSYPWLEEDDDGPQCMAEFATRILRDNHLDHTWSVMWTPGPVVRDKFSFSTENSNPYNAMVEAANVLGYKFHVNYEERTITFYLPESEENKFSGYRYRPETNLKSFSASYDATQLCTIMHAVGGTDAQEQIIPLTPALPHAFKQWFTQNESWKTGTSAEWIDQDEVYTKILQSIIEEEEEEQACQIKDYKVQSASYIVVDESGKIIEGEQNKYKYFTGISITSSHKSSLSDNGTQAVEVFVNEQLQQEIDECVEFAKIADRVPYLGQFLCDFSFFDSKHSGLMSDSTYKNIQDILNNMRIHNTTLKIHTPAYYNILYTIAKKHVEMETLAEQYQAEWRVIADKLSGKSESNDIAENLSVAQTICNKLTSLFSNEYFNLFKSAYGKHTEKPKTTNDSLKFYSLYQKENALLPISELKNIYPEWQNWITNLEHAEKQYQIHQSKYWSLNNKLTMFDGNVDTLADKIMLEAEIESEKNYLKTYETLKSSYTVGDIVVPGKWSLLLSVLHKTMGTKLNKIEEEGLSSIIEQAERENSRETARLYANYGDFIYESTYENTDELDSVGLYNQTVNNFALYNKPAASYSMTTIDLNCLEQISIPNVVVGAKIRVYNELLNLKDGENNNLQYTNNDLTITAISRKLRSSDDVSFTVEKTNRINKLVEKLLINL